MASLFSQSPADSLFSQPPVAYFQPLESPPHTCAPSFISCETSEGRKGFGGSSLTEFETISSKVCGWAGELGKDHDLRQGADHCGWLFSEQSAPFHIGAELPSSALIPTAQRQPRVDFLSSASAMKSIFRAACDAESEIGVTVHRLGDWLVIDDGAEISSCLAAGTRHQGPSEDCLAEERQRCLAMAEQRRRAAAARAEVAEARAAGAQERLEAARAAHWQAEVEARRAQEVLREMRAEVARAAEECERLCSRCPCASTHTAAEPPGRQPAGACPQPPEAGGAGVVAGDACGAAGGAGGTDTPAAPGASGGSSRIRCLDIEMDEPEELQLYRNFLGHSIRLLKDEAAHEPRAGTPPAEPPKAKGAGGPAAREKLVPVDGPPGVFRQVGVWKIADDASVVVGSRMLCLGNVEHPKLTLFLHNEKVLSDMQLLEHWVECLIAGVPEFAVCFHRNGAVQSYTVYKVSELRSFLEERLAIGKRLQMTLQVLRWIKRQCCLEGCTYWLSKAKSEPRLKLFKLCGAASAEGSQKKVGLVEKLPMLYPVLGKELVVKNTFLDWPDEEDEADQVEGEQAECADARRSQSCPARFCGIAACDGDAAGEPRWWETRPFDQTCLSLPLRRRVSALFFRRAESLPPGPDAVRFIQHALDLELTDGVRGSPPGGPLSGRLFLQACCHLGLALCQIPPALCRHGGPPAGGGCSPGGDAQADEDVARALLATLRADAPGGADATAPRTSYQLRPLEGCVGCAALLLVGVPLRRPGGAAARPAAEAAAEAAESGPPQPLAAALGAADRVADAFDLLATAARGGAGDCHRLEALAFPAAALALLRLATELARAEPARGGAAALAHRAASAARRFAALDAAQCRPEPQPLFACLPRSEELLVRVEHLCGWLAPLAGAAAAEETRAGGDASGPQERGLLKLEGWLEASGRERASAALALLAARLGAPSETVAAALGDGPAEPAPAAGGAAEAAASGRQPRGRHLQHVQAAWHYERSIRLLRKSMQRGGALLSELMLLLACALAEAACGLAQEAASGGVPLPLEQLLRADGQLGRAEGLASAAGHPTVSAVLQAGRAHLRSLAADLVLRAGASSPEAQLPLATGQAAALWALCGAADGEDEDAAGYGRAAERETAHVGTCIGRLGDRAMELALEAHGGVAQDAAAAPEAAASLALMASGALQAAAARLRALPPPGMEPAQCSRVVLAMLSQALQLLPQQGHGGHGAACLRQCAAFGPGLCAHAHLMACEVHAEARSAGGVQQRQQRVLWHLDRARAALHGAGADADSAGTAVMLVHVHVAHARLLSSGVVASKRQAEAALEELVAGCRVLAAGVARRAEGAAGPLAAAGARRGAAEARALLLERARGALRGLCASAGRGGAAGGPWKGLYRDALGLTPDTVLSLPELYDRHCAGGGP